MKCYLIIWTRYKDELHYEQKELTDFINTVPEIVNWRADAGAIFIVSDQHENKLSEIIHGKFPKLRFIIAPIIIQNIQGWASNDTWEFIKNPKPSI
jgi:hypothetical protein